MIKYGAAQCHTVDVIACNILKHSYSSQSLTGVGEILCISGKTVTPISLTHVLNSGSYGDNTLDFGIFNNLVLDNVVNSLIHFLLILIVGREGIVKVVSAIDLISPGLQPENLYVSVDTLVKFTFNGNEVEDDFIFAAVSNTTSVGGVLKLKDTLVALNDGEFELLLVKHPKDLVQLNKILGEVVSQKFEGNLVSLYHASEITVESNDDIDWTLDGECEHAGKKAHIKNVKSAIDLIVPNKSKI